MGAIRNRSSTRSRRCWQSEFYGLALGYEDVNDHEQLRTDPVFGILAGRAELNEPLAGKSTLNRMELGTGINDRYKKITPHDLHVLFRSAARSEYGRDEPHLEDHAVGNEKGDGARE